MGRRHHSQKTEEILFKIEKNLQIIENFFQRDQSFALLKFNLNPHTDDARLVALLPRIDGERFLEAQLRRLLGTRSLALRRAADDSVSNSQFLSREGLDDTELDALRQGLRTREIESGVGSEGISLLILPCFAQLLRLTQDEVQVLIKTLSQPRFLLVADMLTPLLHFYQQKFDDDIAFYTKPTGKEKRQDGSFPFMVNYRRVELPESGSQVGNVKYRNYKKRK